MSKVVLLAVNAKYVHSSLSVWYLYESVSRFSRHDVSVIEATINQTDADILAQIVAANPEILGISTYIWNARKLEILLKNIRKHLPETTIVLGGPEASYNTEFWLSQGADFVIQGEGEHSFPQLLDALADNNAPSAVTLPSEPEDIVNPYTDAYFNALHGRIAYLETSRGCPFQCKFCLSGGSKLRFFPLDTAKENLLKLSQSGAKTIKLVDRTFNCNAERAYHLLKYVIHMDTNCCFHFEVAADLFDERTLALLRSAPAGRIQLEAGLQSFYQPTLDAVSRQTSPEKAEQNIKTLLDGQNIHVHIDLIAGLPFETLPHFQQSFNRAYALGAHTLQLGFLKLLHGSALRAQAEQLGLRYNAAPPYEITGSPWLNAGELRIIKQVENALQLVYNSGRFLSTVQYVLYATGISQFELYRRLGEVLPEHGAKPEHYAEQLYLCFKDLPGVDGDALCDHMVCDWLCSMRGKNMPPFLRKNGGQRSYAECITGRKIERCEMAVLRTGEIVFIDSAKADPVTGRYELHRKQS